MSQLYTIKVSFKGIGKSVSVSHQDHLLTRIYRLSTKDRTKMQQSKVSLYRLINKWSVFKMDESYIVPESALSLIEDGFREIYANFEGLRNNLYLDILRNWGNIKQDIESYLAKMGINEDISSLDPPNSAEDLLDLNYTLIPLSATLQQLLGTSTNLQGVDSRVAERLKKEHEKKIQQIESQYEKKMKELQDIADKLNANDKLKDGEIRAYKLQLSALKDQAESIAPLLGDEKEDDLKSRLEGLKGFFTDTLGASDSPSPMTAEVGNHRDA